MNKNKKDFNDLKDIVARLRGKDGCPWDKEQDEKTIKNYLLEETHEIIHAIENEDYDNLKEELGDVLFQILFLADIAEEKGYFDIFDSISTAYDKFVRRHPHVFKRSDDTALSVDEVISQWDDIKREEKGKDKRDILEGVSKTQPALLRALEVSRRAAKVGFDWEKSLDVIDKIDEEVKELRNAVESGDHNHIEEELGDIFFAMVNLSRFFSVNPENALNRTTNKFIKRFYYIQEKTDFNLAGKGLEYLESLWEEAKKA